MQLSMRQNTNHVQKTIKNKIKYMPSHQINQLLSTKLEDFSKTCNNSFVNQKQLKKNASQMHNDVQDIEFLQTLQDCNNKTRYQLVNRTLQSNKDNIQSISPKNKDFNKDSFQKLTPAKQQNLNSVIENRQSQIQDQTPVQIINGIFNTYQDNSQQIIDNLINQTQKNLTSNRCINHQNKKGKYKILNNNTIAYCSKCSIHMSSQNFQMVENKSLQRVYKINEMINVITLQTGNVGKVFKSLFQKYFNIQNFYKEQTDQIHNFYDNLIKLIHEEKEQQLNSLQNSYQSNQEIYSQHFQNINQVSQDVINISENIVKNVSQKIDLFSDEEFQKVMDIYEKQNNIHSNKTHNIQQCEIKVLKNKQFDIKNILQQIQEILPQQREARTKLLKLGKQMKISSVKQQKQYKTVQEVSEFDNPEQQTNKNEINKNVNKQLISFENKEIFTAMLTENLNPNTNKVDNFNNYLQQFNKEEDLVLQISP